MKRRILTAAATLFLLLLAACGTPVSETIAGQAKGDWVLESINEAPPPAPLRIRFTASGKLEGTGPCNQFSAKQTAPLPWFALADMTITERTCPALAEEAELLAALSRMVISEATGDTLLLTDETGGTLLFRQAAEAG